MPKLLRTLAAVTLAAVLGAGLATAASAVLTARTGTISERQTFMTETNAWATSSAAYVNVPGAAITFVVPSGTTRIVDTRFTAESQCTGTSGWCTVRVVYFGPGGGPFELNPVVATDFAFDSSNPSGNDLWESHAIERSTYRLGAGTYRFVVQARVVGASSLRLDDWHFAGELVRP